MGTVFPGFWITTIKTQGSFLLAAQRKRKLFGEEVLTYVCDKVDKPFLSKQGRALWGVRTHTDEACRNPAIKTHDRALYR